MAVGLVPAGRLIAAADAVDVKNWLVPAGSSFNAVTAIPFTLNVHPPVDKLSANTSVAKVNLPPVAPPNQTGPFNVVDPTTLNFAELNCEFDPTETNVAADPLSIIAIDAALRYMLFDSPK